MSHWLKQVEKGVTIRITRRGKPIGVIIGPVPKWASRSRFRRTAELRVERLLDISEADALAEGVKPSDAAVVYRGTVRQPDIEMTARGAFLCLCDGINGARGPVAENPPVIVVRHESGQAEEVRAVCSRGE